MEEDIFKKCEIDFNKLIDYGFIIEKNIPTYRYTIPNKNLEILITYKNNKLKGKIIDKEINEEYLSYRIENQVGEFVNGVREEFIKILEEIRNNCCRSKYYIGDQANRISNLIKKKYDDNPEFLWDNDEDNSVFRNTNNKKWYGIIMYINKNKLTDEDKMIEVINIKLPKEEIDTLVTKKGFYRAYHMNKKYWVTITLDDTLDDSKIMELIDKSHNYTIEINEWVIPTNLKYFDIINYFDNNNVIEWKQPRNININDIVYIYVGKPYSCIYYKCKVVDIDLKSPYPNWANKTMKIKLIEKYPKDKYSFDIIKKYGLKSVRNIRRMPIQLVEIIKKDK